MATAFSEIITGAMDFFIDVRWQEQLAQDPAQFFRAKSANVIHAIPRFNCPPNMQEYLTYTTPSYADYLYVPGEDKEAGTEVPTQKMGFELCSVCLETQYANGSVSLVPVAHSYDAETGIVTLDSAVSAGSSVIMDFYTDGQFKNDLDDNQKRILSLCVAVDWYFQFANNYLGIANLVTDKSFSIKSPSEHIRANTERLRELQAQLRSELMAYEQRLYKVQGVPPYQLPKV